MDDQFGTHRITCADAVAKVAFDGSRRESLLQDCYTVDPIWVAGRRTRQLGQRRPQSQ